MGFESGKFVPEGAADFKMKKPDVLLRKPRKPEAVPMGGEHKVLTRVKSAGIEKMSAEKSEKKSETAEVPILAHMIASYEATGSKDPVGDAREAIYDRFKEGVSEDEKRKQMARMEAEYAAWKKKNP